MKTFLDIDNCIILNDVKAIKEEPPKKKIKTKRQLSKQILKKKLVEGSESAIYTKLWRFEKDGYTKEPTDIIHAVLKILDVSRDDLVKTV
jgi:hypothetical protein